MFRLFLCTFILTILQCALAARPVALIHGILHGMEDMAEIESWINEDFPDTYTHNIEIGNGAGTSVFDSMTHYIDTFAEAVRSDTSLHPEFHIVAHSQGALVSRGYIQMYAGREDYPAVRNFISLSGPHGGFYCGESEHGTGCAIDNPVLQMVADLLADSLVYTPFVQGLVVPAGYWMDAFNMSRAIEGCQVVPVLNNQRKNDPVMAARLQAVENIVLAGSHLDGVITPWESAFFGFYDDGQDKVAHMGWEDPVWTRLGLDRMYDEGRLILEFSGLEHRDYLDGDTGRDFFDRVTSYYLD
eukprot:gnl/Dysnectes_brevis/3151_a3927_782.p1 GENE.gnl/Dysnectes_brevis/3151_a3927_782~~gnl/Dysnectes_brevis/3151_a3927_782.p1  ORF type:complete len:300 (+),score=107.73 gnl/Dysnectes_brevis/3151_a3927_782:638-1537(+)